jgi:hypothetical protein
MKRDLFARTHTNYHTLAVRVFEESGNQESHTGINPGKMKNVPACAVTFTIFFHFIPDNA